MKGKAFLDIDKQYDYKADPGPSRLLGALCIVMCPTAMFMSFQQTDLTQSLNVIGKGYFFYFTGAIVPWIVRLLAIALIPIGVLFFKGAKEQIKSGARIVFTPHGFIYESGPPAGTKNLIKYSNISDIRIEKKQNQSILHFTANGAKRFILSNSMKSMDEFNKMASMLTDRTASQSK